MKASEFINKLQNIVDNYKTLYVMGCFGRTTDGRERVPLLHKSQVQQAGRANGDDSGGGG